MLFQIAVADRFAANSARLPDFVVHQLDVLTQVMWFEHFLAAVARALDECPMHLAMVLTQQRLS